MSKLMLAHSPTQSASELGIVHGLLHLRRQEAHVLSHWDQAT